MERIIIKNLARNECDEELTGQDRYKNILASLEDHTKYRDHCINLIASENRVSPAASAVLSSDLVGRYSVGPEVRWFPGLSDYTKIETATIDMLKETLHGADHINVQPVTGMVANMVAFHSVIERGSRVLVTHEKHGGHYSHRAGNMGVGSRASSLLDMYGVGAVESLPFDNEKYNIDVDKSAQKIKEFKPNVIIIGTSEMLFPAPVHELREIAGENVQILFDAAHVFGLIIGDHFQQPLVEGADMLVSSTNKTLGAPAHGIVAWTDEAQSKYDYRSLVNHALVPLFTSSHDAAHVAGLGVTMAEMKVFGKEYALQVVKNAQALGKALDDEGLKIVASRHGYTRSHEILIDTQTADSGVGMRMLEEANIIVSRCPIPDFDGNEDTGLRLGTNEMTRMGMKEDEMKLVAKFITDALFSRRNLDDIAKEVYEFREGFQEQKFCLELKK